MKKFLVLVIVTFLLSAPLSRAQETPESTPQAALELIPTQTIEYTLPYPGLLPDSPLYFLKIVRDRVISFLISDTVKKAEFNLLQADKRLGSGAYLFKKDKSKTRLAEETISKGENYFEQAIAKAKEAKKEGRDIKPITQKLSLAVEKHAAVLQDLIDKTSGSLQEDFKRIRLRVEKFSEDIRAISLK